MIGFIIADGGVNVVCASEEAFKKGQKAIFYVKKYFAIQTAKKFKKFIEGVRK